MATVAFVFKCPFESMYGELAERLREELHEYVRSKVGAAEIMKFIVGTQRPEYMDIAVIHVHTIQSLQKWASPTPRAMPSPRACAPDVVSDTLITYEEWKRSDARAALVLQEEARRNELYQTKLKILQTLHALELARYLSTHPSKLDVVLFTYLQNDESRKLVEDYFRELDLIAASSRAADSARAASSRAARAPPAYFLE